MAFIPFEKITNLPNTHSIPLSGGRETEEGCGNSFAQCLKETAASQEAAADSSPTSSAPDSQAPGAESDPPRRDTASQANQAEQHSSQQEAGPVSDDAEGRAQERSDPSADDDQSDADTAAVLPLEAASPAASVEEPAESNAPSALDGDAQQQVQVEPQPSRPTASQPLSIQPDGAQGPEAASALHGSDELDADSQVNAHNADSHPTTKAPSPAAATISQQLGPPEETTTPLEQPPPDDRQGKRSDTAGGFGTPHPRRSIASEEALQPGHATSAGADLSSASPSSSRAEPGEPAPTPSAGENGSSSAANNSDAPPVTATPTRIPQHLLSRPAPRDTELSLRDVDQDRFLHRVARAFQAARDRGGQLRLRLSPPELGSLRLEVRLQNGALHARLETESTVARTLLLDNLPVLRERLAEQGVRVEQFDVDVMDRQADNLPRQTGRDGDAHASPSDPAAPVPSEEEPPHQSAAAVASPDHQDAKLDVLI